MRITLLQQKINRKRHQQVEYKGLLAKAQGLIVSRKVVHFPKYPLSKFAVLCAVFFFCILFIVIITSPQNKEAPVLSELEPGDLKTPANTASIKIAGLGSDLLALHLPDIRLTDVKVSASNTTSLSGDNSVKMIPVDWTVPENKTFSTSNKSKAKKESSPTTITNTNKAKKPNKAKRPDKVKKIENAESLNVSFPQELNIAFQNKTDGRFVSTHLALESELPTPNLTYIWDLGDGRKSYEKKFAYTYKLPGLYQVQLTVRNEHGLRAKSNVLNVKIPDTNEHAHPRPEFITLNKMNEVFYTNKRLVKAEDALNQIDQPVKLISEDNGVYGYQSCAPGFFSLTFANDEAEVSSYLFVSPFESVHSDRSDCNWYRTQFNTGLSNCGPATASMGIGWANGQYVDVKDVRQFIGWQGNGATSFDDLRKTMAHYGVNSVYTDVQNRENIFKLIDRGSIAIFLFHTGSIPQAKANPEYDLVGKYYPDAVGHYIIIKGYSVDKQYFIVYDPIPSDWSCNGKRYGDGVSMLGRNRYYAADLLMKSMKTSYVLEITREAF